ncbi:MAG TPA: hypothetical protein VF801_11665 [Rhodocyclaceae bacterium]
MTARQTIQDPTAGPARECRQIGDAVHAAVGRGLIIGRQVKLGVVRGIVIGYNISRRGRYPGARYPLLVKTELGIAKCRVDEVVPV